MVNKIASACYAMKTLKPTISITTLQKCITHVKSLRLGTALKYEETTAELNACVEYFNSSVTLPEKRDTTLNSLWSQARLMVDGREGAAL